MDLFKVTEQYRQIDALLEESGGVLTPELEKALVINEKNRDEAFKNLYYLLKEKQADLPGLKKTIDELQEIKKKRELQIDSLKKQLVMGVETFGVQNIDGVKLSIRPSQACNTDLLEAKISAVLLCLGEKKLSDVITEDGYYNHLHDNDEIFRKFGALKEFDIDLEFLKELRNLITEGLISEDLTLSIKPKKKELTTYINTEQKDVPGAYIEHRNNLSVK